MGGSIGQISSILITEGNNKETLQHQVIVPIKNIQFYNNILDNCQMHIVFWKLLDNAIQYGIIIHLAFLVAFDQERFGIHQQKNIFSI